MKRSLSMLRALYERFALPRLVHHACSTRPVRRQRKKIVPLATGRVLEIGLGSGLNLPFYSADRVEKLWGLEPSTEMWDLAQEKIEAAEIEVEPLEAGAEEIPLPDESMDTVVVTYTLCTIPDAPRALQEVRRVLREDGRLLFCEHGAAPDEDVHRWQRRIEPLWKRFSGGCHLTRPILGLLDDAGFRVDVPSSMYLPGWRPATFNVWGTAVPALDAGRGSQL